MAMSVTNIDLITDTVGMAEVVGGRITVTPQDMERLLNSARDQGRGQQTAEMATAVVMAAGGEVRINPSVLQDIHKSVLWRQDDHATGAIVLFVKPRGER